MNRKRVANSVAFGTRIAPSTAKQLRTFAKKNKMPISTITNSALKIFIEDAKKIAENTDGKSFSITPFTNAAEKHNGEVKKRIATSKIYEKVIMSGLTRVKRT
jgi:hypothetical protein